MMRGLSACLLFLGLTQAADVYLSPPGLLPSRLSPHQASQVLAAHLGLDQFEQLSKESAKLGHIFAERDFVASGNHNALLLLVDERYALDVLPPTLLPNFSFNEPSKDYLSAFLKTCTRRATHVFSFIFASRSVPTQGVPRALDFFSAPTPVNEAFLTEISTLTDYIDTSVDRFAGLQLTSIPQLALSYGRESESYQLAIRAVRSAIEMALSDRSVRFALLTYTPPSAQKRTPQLSQQSPIPPTVQQTSTRLPKVCYASEDACLNGTNACSGHGSCLSTSSQEGECFVCSCETTKSESGQTQIWVGDMCERQDVSSAFVLLVGTVTTLFLLMGGSISLLYAVGSQEFPSILTGGIAGALRKE
ncbi:hypothetical protein EV401DRAFT_2250769 [Pisolithus croceorrhizus]|nr:hypothetical protein EV401DRAFT_2250769 [Pisolithus croceorrhizus]